MNSERRVVVTGCGVATPFGIGIDALWDALINGTSGVRRTSAFDPDGLRCRLGAEVPPLKMSDFVPKTYRKSVKVMARDIELAVACAYDAVRDAGLRSKCLIDRGEVEGPPSVDSTRFGANIGAGLICADLAELAGALSTCGDPATGSFDYQQWGGDGMGNLTPLWLLKFLPNMLGCHVTIVHDAQAPSNTITCGEASSHLAIGEAFRTIARGAADVCICGGAESKMNPMGVMRQELIGRLVTNDGTSAEDACRPFDSGVDGMIPGESGGLLILEELEFARARGARIYAEVVGFGAGTNTYSWSEPEPDGASIALAARNALRDAGMTADDIDLVCTFATGCNDYDKSEAAALKTVFANRSGIGAIALKGRLGNGGAGSGAVDLAITLQAMRHHTIPPSPHVDSAALGGLLRFADAAPVDAPVRTALSYAYALSGGQAAAIVIRQWPADGSANDG